ncbi:hypothetical protein KP509_20G088900 [Ceratopteris richardii]|uniref:Uncharacterized protein n=1 Tax=Ceratopteris richardii TaxID=49495 RepID=A0A8T2SH40_CERRI|nr:hypothetical protein KP509_20G088900 [Ceratopteris richardii]
MEQDGIYCRLYHGEGHPKKGDDRMDDVLGELKEEEIVWGEVEMQQSKEAGDGCGGKEELNDSRRSEHHRQIGRKYSMLSRQIEIMQAMACRSGEGITVVRPGRKTSEEWLRDVEGADKALAEEGANGLQRCISKLVPPHELMEFQYKASASPSVLQGAGRTLKGMDLRRLRNEVWRQTGFLD